MAITTATAAAVSSAQPRRFQIPKNPLNSIRHPLPNTVFLSPLSPNPIPPLRHAATPPHRKPFLIMPRAALLPIQPFNLNPLSLPIPNKETLALLFTLAKSAAVTAAASAPAAAMAAGKWAEKQTLSSFLALLIAFSKAAAEKVVVSVHEFREPLIAVANAAGKWVELYHSVLMVRILLGWFPNMPWEKQPFSAIRDLCDPFLSFFRTILPPKPPLANLDVSPLLAFAFLGVLSSLLKAPVQPAPL